MEPHGPYLVRISTWGTWILKPVDGDIVRHGGTIYSAPHEVGRTWLLPPDIAPRTGV
jgi:hypothetical protein